MQTLCTIHAIAQRPDGKILLLQRTNERDRPGKWNCVTGYIKEKEPAEVAALRELKEETNLQGSIIRSGELYTIEKDEMRWVIVPFLIQVETVESMKIDTGESQDHRWVLPEDPMIESISPLKMSLGKLGMR